MHLGKYATDKVFVNGKERGTRRLHNEFKKDPTKTVMAICPDHKKPCTLIYDDDGLMVKDCIDCTKEGIELLIPVQSTQQKEKIPMRVVAIRKVAEYILSADNKELRVGKIMFFTNSLGDVGIYKIAKEHDKLTYEVISLSEKDLRKEIQAILDNEMFSKADQDGVIDYYLHNKKTTFKRDVSYIAEPSNKLQFTFKVIENVNANEDALLSCVIWKSVIDRISDGKAFAAFVWSIFETQHIGRQMLYIQGARGEEGKSIISKAIMEAIGRQYCASMRPSDFSTSSNFGMSKAEGKRLILIPDVNNDKLLKYDGLKQILGKDPVSIENKYEKSYTSIIDCRVLAFSNYGLKLQGEKYETSRLIWLTIDPMKKFEKNLQQKLTEEFPTFLQYCRWAYNELCKNHYEIKSAVSLDTINETVQTSSEDILQDYESYFEFDEDSYITRKSFNAVLKLVNPRISNKEIGTIKQALITKGIQDICLSTGYRMNIKGKRTPVYRGLKYRGMDND